MMRVWRKGADMSDQDAIFQERLNAALGGAAVETPTEQAEPTTEPAQSAEPKAEESKPDAPVITDKDRAIALGWNPDKDAYEGKTGKEWVSAGTFLRQREMADEISRSHRSEKQLRKELEQLRKQVNQDLGEIRNERNQRQLNDLQAQIRQAAADQDYDKLDELVAKRDGIVAPKQEAEPESDADSTYDESPERVAEVAKDWKAENAWFDKSPAAVRDEAIAIEQRYTRANPGCSVADSLAFVKYEMERRHPELRAYSSSLRKPDATPRSAERPAAKGYTPSQLTGLARTLYDRLDKQGIFKTEAQRTAYLKEAIEAGA